MTASSENSCFHFILPSDGSSSSSRISIYYNQNNSFVLDIFSATQTLSSSILTLNYQCVGAAKEVMIDRVILNICATIVLFACYYPIKVPKLVSEGVHVKILCFHCSLICKPRQSWKHSTACFFHIMTHYIEPILRIFFFSK